MLLQLNITGQDFVPDTVANASKFSMLVIKTQS